MALPDLSVDSFRAYITNAKTKATGIKYAQAAQRFLEFCGKNSLDIDRLPPAVLGLFGESLAHDGLRPASVHTFVAGAKKYLEWLQGRGRPIPALVRADLPKVPPSTPNVVQGNALVQYLALSSRKKEPVRTAMLLLPFCGLRSQELVSLELSHIKRMAVPAHNDRPAQDVVLLTVTGKGGKIRTVPLLLDGKRLLFDYLQRWRRVQVNPRWLFPMTEIHHISPRTLRKHVKLVRLQIGMDRLTPHTLRRTYLTTLYKAGLDPATLAKIAGHASLQTTYDHYLAIEAEDVAGAARDVRLVAKGPAVESAARAGAGVGSFLQRTAEGRVHEVPEMPPLPPGTDIGFGEDDEDDLDEDDLDEDEDDEDGDE